MSRVRIKVPARGDTLALKAVELGRKSTIAGAEGRTQVPELCRTELHAVPLTFHHHTHSNGLNTPGGKLRLDLPPKDGRDLIAVDPVEHPAGLLGFHKRCVELASLCKGVVHRTLGDLVEYHALEGHLGLEQFQEVPGNRLTLAILISC